MAIPSGSGTEVLKRFQANGVNAAYTTFTVTAHHIYTILSVNCCNYEADGTSGKVLLMGFQPNGSGDCWLIADYPIGGRETFVYNEKFVLTAGDVFRIYSDSTNHDVYVAYIDQDWS